MISDKNPEEDIVDFVKNPRIIMRNSDRRIQDLKAAVERKSLNIHPDFQRNSGIWDQGAKSRLIESILVGISIPQVYTAEVIVESEVIEEVVDGQQRLSTIFDFIDGQFGLSDLFFLKPLSKKKYGELGILQKNQILNFMFHVSTLSAMAEHELKFRLFEVLNRGSVALKRQEIRECVFHGSLVNFIRELAKTPIFDGFMKQSLTPSALKRRRAEELVAMFLAFYAETPDAYSAKISFINLFYKNHRNDDASFENWRSLFTEVCLTIRQIFGKAPFRIPVKLSLVDRKFNEAYFEMLMYAFTQINDHVLARKYKVHLLDVTMKKVNEPEFQALLSGHIIPGNVSCVQVANSAANVKRRLEIFTNLIKEGVKESNVVLSEEDLERKHKREQEEIEAKRDQ